MFRKQAANILLKQICRPLLGRICWGRKVPEGFEQWKNVSFSWSQFGEDLVIRSALQKAGLWEKPMVYVDVGAFHPIKYSNTLLLNLVGWKGINIDPNPVTVELFNVQRPDDLNLWCGVSNAPGKGHYQQSVKGEVSATGSLVKIDSNSPNSVIDNDCLVKVPLRRLDEILDDYDWQNMRFGLLNVDIEGTELDVLQSNCWFRFRPIIISIEENDLHQSRIEPFLQDQNYKLVAECFLTKIFIDATLS